MRRVMTQSALVFASVLMIVALAGCGGSKTAATLMPVTGLPEDRPPLQPGTTSLSPGERGTVGEADGVRTVATCPDDGPACVVTVAADGSVSFTGGEPTFATYTPITGLPEGALEPGTFSLSPGENRPVGGADGMRTLLTCPSGGEACVVTVGEDGAAASTGGAPTVATYTPIDLPNGHTLEPGTRTIAAGESLTVWAEGAAETVVTCPDDGPACEVTFGSDGSAEYTGGTPTVVSSLTGLPEGHILTAGTIPAGESRTLKGAGAKGVATSLACPEGGEDCLISFVSGSVAEFEGGTPTVTSMRNDMVWQANNGPDGTSDGAHARNLQGRLLTSGTSVNHIFRFQTDATMHGAIVLNTRSTSQESHRTVTPSASWATGTAPTLGLSVSGTGSNTFSVDEDSAVPSLGTGWNAAVLSKTGNTGRTALAVVHSNIEDGTGGTADNYYMTFGAWMEIPDSSTAASSNYNWGGFGTVTTSVGLTRPQMLSLSGNVTYQGPASGIYSMATYNSSNTLESAVVGSFTATANIFSDLGGSGYLNNVGGNITDFRENGEPLPGDWRVNFQATNMTQATFPNIYTANIASGTVLGDEDRLRGRYGMQFFRNTAGGLPSTVAGVFAVSTHEAVLNARQIVGAFGASSN